MKNDKKVNKICIDANTAVGYVGYAFSEVACIYPITPSSVMAEVNDEKSSIKEKNLFGEVVKVVELQNEKGAAGAVHGSLAAGALTTTYTASQGLLLMIPNMYKIAGEMLPSVFHVSARALASHALSIFGDHSDVMATRQTGFCILASNNVQEAMDLAIISHVSTYKASLPFLHFFDGFRTSHEINKIENVPYEIMKKLLPLKEIKQFRDRGHNPVHPIQTGTAQNPDIFFQNREACNIYYDQVYDKVLKTMNDFAKLTGRQYRPFMYLGAKDATDVIVLMGSACDTAEEVTKHLNKNGEKTGVLKVHLYRPFNAKAFVESLPKTTKHITVLDRTKEPGAAGEPLYVDVMAALNDQHINNIEVFGGRYGLGGKDITPENFLSIFENMSNTHPLNHFSVGINDDVTKLSLPTPKKLKIAKDDIYECIFYGLGSDGTVSANKSSIKIIGEETDNYIQGYFEYDSKKSGSLTRSHLRMSSKVIKMPYLIDKADFIAIHNYAFINQYDILKYLKPNGTVLLNTTLSFEQLGKELPESFKKQLKTLKAKLHVIPANNVALEAGLRNRINVIMQACFFKLTNIIDYKLAESEMKKFAYKSYSKKGDAIVQANYKGIDMATTQLKEIDVNKLCAIKSQSLDKKEIIDKYFKKFIKPISIGEGNTLPVSTFDASGTVPTDTTKFEKRGIALNVPVWDPSKCIQCGQCTMVCPHAAIRPQLLDEKAMKLKPNSLKTANAMGINGKQYVVQCSPLDCTGCESCARVCPAKEKALVMKPLHEVQKEQIANYEFTNSLPIVTDIPFKHDTVKGLQFSKPYFEFHGACSGCGETPYIKVLTQLFGKNLLIANATGCSCIYGGSAPTCPYTKDEDGNGPSWGNSLFEDNAEFGYGMKLASDFRRNGAFKLLDELKTKEISSKLKQAIENMQTNKENTSLSNVASKHLIDALKNEKVLDSETKELINKAINNADQYPRKVVWLVGGDGWSYDIDYDGVDHVLASNENINILILDTEVYSNTGGQSSKATPAGSVAKFAANGKSTRKKDIGQMAMTYKNIYVAQVAMGANPQQLINALVEAEAYNGPSLVVCYSPCINHGINMSNSQLEEKRAVQSGYWNLYRYNPVKKDNPLTIDNPADPTLDYREFLVGENRYASLLKKNPDCAEKLFAASRQEAYERKDALKQLCKK